MIRSFRSQGVADLFNGVDSAAARRVCPREVWAVAIRKLTQLDTAARLADMAVPPNNRLEKLVGDRAGQWSVRINQKYRVVFTWTPEGPTQVEIVDYHRG